MPDDCQLPTADSLDTSRAACPSPHSTGNKIGRVIWCVCWWLMFRPSPRILFKWRVVLLRAFRGSVDWNARIDPTVRIWAPWNLTLGKDSSIGHHVECYNVAPVTIEDTATVSQYALLCAASHDIHDPQMRLTSAPIKIESGAWVCARAFVGPGVTIGTGAVLGACGVTMKSVEPWHIMAGNPAQFVRKRELE